MEFKPNQTLKSFRVYEKDSPIYRHYKELRSKQTLQHVRNMLKQHCSFSIENPKKMTVWEAFDKINNTFIDSSDPDIKTLSNDYHAFQTAEAMRKAGEPEWLQVVGLIHDLGKIIFLDGSDVHGTSVNSQWSVGGDTFIVGCHIPDKVVYPKLNELNPDMADPKLNTKFGIYVEHCGLDNCLASFGHDEYLYRVLMYNKQANPEFHCKLPEEAFYIIRWHSLYPWHQHSAYSHLASPTDWNRLPLLQKFTQYDLYTKDDNFTGLNDSLWKYYDKLLKRYFSTTTWYW